MPQLLRAKSRAAKARPKPMIAATEPAPLAAGDAVAGEGPAEGRRRAGHGLGDAKVGSDVAEGRTVVERDEFTDGLPGKDQGDDCRDPRAEQDRADVETSEGRHEDRRRKHRQDVLKPG